MRLFTLSLLLCLSTQAFSQFVDVAPTVGLAIPGAKDGGATFADFNQDGCLDILINTSSGAQRSRLLVSDCASPPNYTDQTASLAPHLFNNTLERSAVWGDFNNDGYVDFARNRSGHLEIYQNQGPNGSPAWSFGNMAHEPNFEITNLANGLNCEGLAWMDYNGDGFLDLVLENHNFGVDLLLNPGDCSANFIHSTPNATPLGLPTSATDGDYMASGDYNDDGWVDLLVRKQNQNDLWRNDGGTFSNIQNIDNAANGNKGAVLFADFDNDGDMDLFWTAQGTNQIWEQTAPNVFSPTGEPSASSGVPLGNGIDACAAADVDNDGDIDLFLSDDSGPSFLFINQSSTLAWDFSQNNGGINIDGDGEGATFADYDNDGDLDLYINVSNKNNQLWENQTDGSDYFFVRPELDLGGGFTRFDHGATAVLRSADGNTILGGIRDSRGSYGHGTQYPEAIHFGLPNGPNQQYLLSLHFTNIGGERIEIDTLITPANLVDQTFRYVRSSFGVLTNIGCNLLPISLLKFDATPKTNEIELSWETISEQNNSHFEIEHSTDGFFFAPLTTVLGNGTSFEHQSYAYTHFQPSASTNYYRLFQIDLDGQRNGPWYAIASLENEAFTVRAFPNPMLPHHHAWFVKISGAKNSDISVSLYGSDGKMHLHEEIFADSNYISLEFDKPNTCTPGIYILEVVSNTRKLSRQIIFY